MILAMHIPDGMVGGAVCPLTAIIATTGILAAFFAVLRSPEKPSPTKFGAVSALVFALQMLNFPIAMGVSGHLVGGVLAAVLLGIPSGILSVSLVLVAQCLLFADGGIFSLGANIVNMSLLGAGVGGWIARTKNGALSPSRIALASWVSVMSAALACSLELAISNTAPLSSSLAPMLATHSVIGLGEALLTIAAVYFFRASYSVSCHRENAWIPLSAAVCLVALVSPFASKLPDGLEWSASILGLSGSAQQALPFVSPLSDYALPFVSQEVISTALAGTAGCAAVFFLALLLATAWKSRVTLSGATR